MKERLPKQKMVAGILREKGKKTKDIAVVSNVQRCKATFLTGILVYTARI